MITSPRNRRLVDAARLKRRAAREEARRFLVEGERAVADALASGAAVEEIFVSGDLDALRQILAGARLAGVPLIEIGPAVVGHLASAVSPQGVVAVARFVDISLQAFPANPTLVPVLFEIRDPGNAGAILRSAVAFGADGVVFSRGSVDVYNDKAVRASAGSLFHLPVVRDADLEETVAALRQRGLRILAAHSVGEERVQDVDLTKPTAVVFGNEARGLTDEVLAMVDGSIRVSMSGKAESLNLAVAVAVLLFEAARQRSPAAGR